MTDKEKVIPICKIGQETGTVPLSCAFGCKREPTCMEVHRQEEIVRSRTTIKGMKEAFKNRRRK